ncbi:sugar phosphate isomerase/epimerase [Polaribacter sp. Z014]|uniref:sugar phosphate isomerase/epimerase family protein n=1 Tax=Polaribacter sp. Z014 TaxID=2927126 RepID=UPI002021D408|nr:sugar phosphate isomerase/epimerase family protein [Polaribacter sp. Z014]MCL7763299.1 sugar phosphate isomerase/epimerase [Polaribacter sp. Z014]
MKRKLTISFVHFILILFANFLLISCNSKPQSSKTAKKTLTANKESTSDFKISLAQWSLHRAFKDGSLDPMDFPKIAASYDIYSIELVNSFYRTKVNDKTYWKTFKQKCDENKVSVGLIMCDRLGNLGNPNIKERMKTVENHYAWVDIARYLGAHSIRVNAAGKGNADDVALNVIDGLSKLGKYASEKGINIIVENHGGNSSNGAWLASVIQHVGMENVGTLPDFGNFCLSRDSEKNCLSEYDRYKGISELIPFAKGISAKSYDFDKTGRETKIDFLRMMKIVKESGFKGYIGIEYEGNSLSEPEGIKATKALLEMVFTEL